MTKKKASSGLVRAPQSPLEQLIQAADLDVLRELMHKLAALVPGWREV